MLFSFLNIKHERNVFLLNGILQKWFNLPSEFRRGSHGEQAQQTQETQV